MTVPESQLSVLIRLSGVRGGWCRVDHIDSRPSDEDLAALIAAGLIEHLYTRPMVCRKDYLRPHTIEDVAVYKITRAGRSAVQAYYDEAGRQRLAQEGRLAK